MKNSIIRKILIFNIFQFLIVGFLAHAGDPSGAKDPTSSYSLGLEADVAGFGGAKGAEVISLWKDGKKSAAKDQVHRWMKEKKKSAEPWVFAAILEFEQKKFKHCISYCNKAIEKGPQTAQAYYWKGRALEAMNKYLEAANEYRAALLIKKDYSNATVRLNGVQTLLNQTSPKTSGK